MMDPLVLTVILLWIVVVAQGVCVLALSRQIGILYERIAPMGALMMDNGPKVGELAPPVDVVTWEGRGLTIGASTGKSTLLFFLSPTCPVCKKLLPIIRSVQSREASWLAVVLASDGDRAEHVDFHARHQLGDFPYVLSQPLGMAFRIAKLPYCVLLDANGIVRAKGLVNSREQIESLLTAYESGIASVQEHIDRLVLPEVGLGKA
jgi:methylamine dehydrogenase accessory protein MauD